MDNRGSAFDKFRRNSPARSDPTAQVLFDYEEHYMRLVKNYRGEIEFINDLHTTHTREVKNFYANDLPTFIKKLEAEPIADDVRREWLKHLEQHMSKSFDMSGHFIDLYKKRYELKWLEAHWLKCKALFDDSEIPLATRREILKIFLRWYQKFVEAWGYESSRAFFFNAEIESLEVLIDTNQKWTAQLDRQKFNAELGDMIDDKEIERSKKILDAIKEYQITMAESSKSINESLGKMTIVISRNAAENTNQYISIALGNLMSKQLSGGNDTKLLK